MNAQIDLSRQFLRTTDVGLEPDSLREMGLISRNLRGNIGDVVLMLAKEAAGFRPVLALDFEILHGYLFPTLQSAHSRIMPTLASYVIRNFPETLVLPPGAIIELLRFADTCYPVIKRMKEYGRSAFNDKPTELIDMYLQIVGDSTEMSLPDGDLNKVVEFVAEALSDVVVGFHRFEKLVASGRIKGFEDLAPNWTRVYESNLRMVKEFAGQLAGTDGSRRRYRSFQSNLNDARNVVATVIANDLQIQPSQLSMTISIRFSY